MTLAGEGPHGPLRRATLTETGHARYAELMERYDATLSAHAELDIPAPEFDPLEDSGPTGPVQAPADCRLSDPRSPAPGDRPGSTSPTPGLHWARDPHDGHLHSLLRRAP